MKSENKEKNEMTFEAALARLEVIVKSLESGSAPLDESLSLFEEGVSLVKFCNGCLDSAEQKVKLLVLSKDGEKYTEEDFAR